MIHKKLSLCTVLWICVSILIGSLVYGQDKVIFDKGIKLLEYKELPAGLIGKLKKKPRIAPEILKLYSVRSNKVFFRALPKQEVILIDLDLMEGKANASEMSESLKMTDDVVRHRDYFLPVKPIVFKIPSSVDHRPKQTPIKDQGSRGTCVAHASMAALEIAYKSPSLDLSENYAYYKFLGSSNANVCSDPGLRTIDAADFLTSFGMCQESYWPYVTTLSGLGCPSPSGWPIATCASHAKYQVVSHKKIYRQNDLAEDKGAYINNPKYLEILLFLGHDIVFGTHVAGWSSGGQGVLDVKTGSNGEPLPSVGGHAMLIVGYNRNGDTNIGGGYFIVKNSWGTGYGQSGYIYLSYDYIRTYAKYGFYITGVKPVVNTFTPVLQLKICPTCKKPLGTCSCK